MKKLSEISHDNYNTASNYNVQDHVNFIYHSPSEEQQSVHKSDSLREVSRASLQLTSDCVGEVSESNRCVECPEVVFEKSIRSIGEQSDLRSTPSYSIYNSLNIDRRVLQRKGITKTGSAGSFGNKVHLPNSTSCTIPGTFTHENYSKPDKLINSSLSPGVQLGARTSIHQLLHHANAPTSPSEIFSFIKATNFSTDDLDYMLKPTGGPLKSQTLVYSQRSKHSSQPPHQEEGSSAASSSSSQLHHPINRESQLKEEPSRESSSVNSSRAPLTSRKQLVSTVASVHQLMVSPQRPRPLRNRTPPTQDQLQDLPLREPPNEIQRPTPIRVKPRREQKKYQKEQSSEPQTQHQTRSQITSERPTQRELDRQRRTEVSTAQNKEINRKRRLSEQTSGNERVTESLATIETKRGFKGRPRRQDDMQFELHNRPGPATRSEPQTQPVSEKQEAPNFEGREPHIQQQNQPHVKRRDIQGKKHQGLPQSKMQEVPSNQPQSQVRLEPQTHFPSETQVESQTTKNDKQRKEHKNQRQGKMQEEPPNQPKNEVRLQPQTHHPSKTQAAPQTARDKHRKKHQNQQEGEMLVNQPKQPQSEVRLQPQTDHPSETQVAPQTTKRDKSRKKHQSEPQGVVQVEPPSQPQSKVQLESQMDLPRGTQVAHQTTKRDKPRKKHQSQRQGEMQVEPIAELNEVRLDSQTPLPSETQVAPQAQSQSESQVEQWSQWENQSEDSIIRRPRQSVSSQFDPIVPAIHNNRSTVRRSSSRSSTRLSLVSPPIGTRRFNVFYSSRDLSLGSDDHVSTRDIHNHLPDPWQHAKMLSNWEAWVHVIKGILGAGILFLPFCFARAGVVAGVVVVCGSSVISYAGHYVIIRRGHEFRQQERGEWIGYAGVVKFAFMRGPWKLRQSASCFGSFTYVLIVAHGMMLGYVYVVIVSSIIGDIIQKYWMDVSFAQSTLFSLGLILPLNLIPTLKFLSTYVLLGNFIFLSGIIILMYYLIGNPTSHSSSNKVAGNLQEITVLFSNALFAAHAVPLIVSVQSCMLNTQSLINRFQVLEFVTVLVTGLFLSLGILGHLKFGDEVKALIIFNLPQDSLAYYCKATFALSICFSHALVIYPVYEFVWEKHLKKSFINSNLTNVRMGTIILRGTLTLLTVVPAFFIVSAAKYCLVFVAMITTVFIIIFPALMEFCIRWDGRRDETFWATRVILFSEILLVLLGIYIFVFGTFWLIDVIRKFTS